MKTLYEWAGKYRMSQSLPSWATVQFLQDMILHRMWAGVSMSEKEFKDCLTWLHKAWSWNRGWRSCRLNGSLAPFTTPAPKPLSRWEPWKFLFLQEYHTMNVRILDR